MPGEEVADNVVNPDEELPASSFLLASSSFSASATLSANSSPARCRAVPRHHPFKTNVYFILTTFFKARLF